MTRISDERLADIGKLPVQLRSLRNCIRASDASAGLVAVPEELSAEMQHASEGESFCPCCGTKIATFIYDTQWENILRAAQEADHE